MSTILEKLNTRFAIIQEDNDDISWKDPRSENYDRQWAEDALYHIIGPLTDNPTWNNVEWSSPSEPVPGWNKGGSAPQWTPEEIVFAFAGDPSMLFQASGNPRSPGYGNKGGAPLYRLARKVAKFAGRADDHNFIEDLYGNGFVPLTQMMKPGYDEARSPFISYVMRTVQSAMEHGTGGSRGGGRAGGHESEFFTNPDGLIRDRIPEKNKDFKGSQKEWDAQFPRHTAIGVQGLLKMKNPEQVREASKAVKGKYQTERLHDKHPDNPFGPYSSKYFSLANNYADALESGETDKIEAMQNQLRQFWEEIDEAESAIRGASTGLGQAISTPDRAKGNMADIKIQLGNYRETNAKGETLDEPEGMKLGDTKRINDKEVLKVDEKTIRLAGNDITIDQAAQQLSNRGLGIQSMDVADDESGNTAAGNYVGDTGVEGSGSIDPESMIYVLDLALNHDLGDILKKSDKFNSIALAAGAKKIPGTNRAKIGGKMTVNELRYLIRNLGPLGANYPGKGRVREKTNIPRDGRGWWQVGEDPEIEPIPEGGLWHSAWERNGNQPMGPTAIAQEMTAEVLEFQKIGIQSARWPKVKQSGVAAGKVSVALQTKSAKVKIIIIGQMHQHQLGMDDGDPDIMDDASRVLKPILEGIDYMDRNLIVATCENMVRLIDKQLLIESSQKIQFKPAMPTFSLKLSTKKPIMQPTDGLLYEDDEEEEELGELGDLGPGEEPGEDKEEPQEEPKEASPDEIAAWDASHAMVAAVGNPAEGLP